jgi:hypothetical protein
MKSAFYDPRGKHGSFKNIILIIDRVGLIGKSLAHKISKEFLVIFVSQEASGLGTENKNIVCVPFFKKIPRIPDGKYSHVIFINDDDENLDLLPIVIKKAREVNAHFIFAQNVFVKGKYPINKILRLYNSGKIVFYGDVFDSKLSFNQLMVKSTVNKYLYQAQKFGKIQIPGEGMGETYPVFLDDVVDGLISLMFGSYKHFLFYLFQKHPISELSLVHMIQRANPEVMVDFIKKESKIIKLTIPVNGISILSEKYTLAKRIREVDIKKKIDVKNIVFRKNISSFRKIVSFMIWVLILLLILPFVSMLLFSFLGKSMFNYAGGEMNGGNLVSAKSSLHLSKILFNLEKQSANILIFQTKTIKKEDFFVELLEDAEINCKLVEIASYIFDSGEYLSKILSDKKEDPRSNLIKSMNSLKTSVIELERLRAENNIPKSVLKTIETAISKMQHVSGSASVLLNALSAKGEKAESQSMTILRLRKEILETIPLIRLK